MVSDVLMIRATQTARTRQGGAPRLAEALGLLMFVCLIVPATVNAQSRQGDPRFELSTNASEVRVGMVFTVELVVENFPMDVQPKLPDFGDLKVQSPTVTHRLTTINGVRSEGFVYSWPVTAPHAGEFTIGPATLEVNGRRYETASLTIVATESGAIPPSLRDMRILPAQVPSSPGMAEALDGRLFLASTVSNERPYVSEPVVVSYTLFRDPRLQTSSYQETVPTVEGALIEELFHAREIVWKESTVDGGIFQVSPMLTQAIVPTRPGTLTAPGYSLLTQVPTRRQSIFDDPFMDSFFVQRGVNVVLPSPDLKLNVRPLPEAGRPANFGGTVGDYQMSATVDREEATESDLVTLTVVIEGRGAI